MNRIVFIKTMDRLVGRAACAFLVAAFGLRKASVPDVPASPSHILVIRPGGIGDAALLYPMLGALRRKYPSARLHVLAEKRNAGVFEANDMADRVILYDRFLFAGFLPVLGIKYDIVIDTEQFHCSSAVVAFLTGARVRVGFDTNTRGGLFTHRIGYSHDDYEADSFLALYRTLTGETVAFDHEEPFFCVDDRYRREAEEAMARLKGKKTVVVLMGASIPERRWSREKYAKVIRWLLDQGINVVLCDADADALLPPALGEGARRELVVALDGKASLAKIAAVTARSDLFLGSDTGILHLAVGVGTPTVALFGPGIGLKWAPRGGRHAVVTKNKPCSPCTRFGTTPPCPNGLVCMEDIGVEDVQEAILHGLGLGG